jgi:hypothetical protein
LAEQNNLVLLIIGNAHDGGYVIRRFSGDNGGRYYGPGAKPAGDTIGGGELGIRYRRRANVRRDHPATKELVVPQLAGDLTVIRRNRKRRRE